jgi:hypothetical protein
LRYWPVAAIRVRSICRTRPTLLRLRNSHRHHNSHLHSIDNGQIDG